MGALRATAAIRLVKVEGNHRSTPTSPTLFLAWLDGALALKDLASARPAARSGIELRSGLGRLSGAPIARARSAMGRDSSDDRCGTPEAAAVGVSSSSSSTASDDRKLTPCWLSAHLSGHCCKGHRAGRPRRAGRRSRARILSGQAALPRSAWDLRCGGKRFLRLGACSIRRGDDLVRRLAQARSRSSACGDVESRRSQGSLRER